MWSATGGEVKTRMATILMTSTGRVRERARHPRPAMPLVRTIRRSPSRGSRREFPTPRRSGRQPAMLFVHPPRGASRPFSERVAGGAGLRPCASAGCRQGTAGVGMRDALLGGGVQDGLELRVLVGEQAMRREAGADRDGTPARMGGGVRGRPAARGACDSRNDCARRIGAALDPCVCEEPAHRVGSSGECRPGGGEGRSPQRPVPSHDLRLHNCTKEPQMVDMTRVICKVVQAWAWIRLRRVKPAASARRRFPACPRARRAQEAVHRASGQSLRLPGRHGAVWQTRSRQRL